MIGLIWAQTEAGVIGRDGTMPWHLPEDLKHFKEITLGSPVIMGRKTWESLPSNARPLPGRRNIVVTRNPEWSADGAETQFSVSDALRVASEGLEDSDWVWVIGGSRVFAESMHFAHRIEVTFIRGDIPGDTFAPELSADWMPDPDTSGKQEVWLASSSELEYRFTRFIRKNPQHRG